MGRRGEEGKVPEREGMVWEEALVTSVLVGRRRRVVEEERTKRKAMREKRARGICLMILARGLREVNKQWEREEEKREKIKREKEELKAEVEKKQGTLKAEEKNQGGKAEEMEEVE